jgi:hypothetical protein
MFLRYRKKKKKNSTLWLSLINLVNLIIQIKKNIMIINKLTKKKT